MRHIELIKVNDAYQGKLRPQQLAEISARYSEFLTIFPGVESFTIETNGDGEPDPLQADMLITIDFESEEAKDEYDMDLDHLALTMEIAEASSSMLVFDLQD